jgi:hypothetical protein
MAYTNGEKKKKYNFVYQIKNLINGKIYVGVHGTYNMNDGYMGSGNLIVKSIAKHGTENFEKTILKQFDSFEEALTYEEFIVNREFVMREDTYNLRTGGYQNPYYSDETRKKISNTQTLRFTNKNERNKIRIAQKRKWATEEYRAKMTEIHNDPVRCDKVSVGVSTWIANNREEFDERIDRINHDPEKIRKTAEKHTGMKRTDETKRKQSASKKKFVAENGTAAFGAGAIYIHNIETKERKRISADEIIPSGWKRGTGKNDKKKESGVKFYIKNIELNTEKMHPKDEEIPEGWIKGRLQR